ncbi:MAG: hypothetical protein QW356_05570 [Candidatus Hadarchaeales archaeon]
MGERGAEAEKWCKVEEAVEKLRTAGEAEVVKGLRVMLLTSCFPVYASKVMKEGFNQQTWFEHTRKAVDLLALSLLGKEVSATGEVGKVFEILHWGEACRQVKGDLAEKLGKIWFVFAQAEVDSPEAQVELLERIEKELGIKVEKVEERLQEITERLKGKWSEVAWEEIFRLPGSVL